MRQTIGILGIPVDKLDTEAALKRLDEFIQTGRFHQVATANVDFLINAMQDRELREILRQADLVTPDGMPVVWASQMLGFALPERVTGADLVPKLAAMAAEKGYRIYMLGALSEVAQRARQRLIEAYPTLQIVGCVSPDVKPLLAMDSETLLRDICAAQPDILLVAFGNPKQEKWIHLHRERLCHIPVCMGVGGTFDFLAGKTSRAPMWMQRYGLEWLYRLAQEPKRLWQRYKNDLNYFSRFLLRQWWAIHTQPKGPTGQIRIERREDHCVVVMSGTVGKAQLPELQRHALAALENSPCLIFHLLPDCALDAAALGTLINLTKRADHIGRLVRVVGGSAALNGLFRLVCAQERITLFMTVEDAAACITSPGLQIAMDNVGTTAVYTLKGVADYKQLQTVQTWLDALPTTINRIDMDLREVSYIDCSMLALLRQFNRSAEDAGRCIHYSVSAAIHSLLARETILNDFALPGETDTRPAPTSQSKSVLAKQGQS
jgi:N-acetylglucosaminyldiphosphoundecaprenol N-acetyl-beta-D-mannosaminyltransferase